MPFPCFLKPSFGCNWRSLASFAFCLYFGLLMGLLMALLIFFSRGVI
jgi:hypothetical protein